MTRTNTRKTGLKGPSRTESPYSEGVRMLLRGLRKAGFSQKQISNWLNGKVTASTVRTAVQEGGNSRHIPESEIKIISDKVGKPRGQLS